MLLHFSAGLIFDKHWTPYWSRVRVSIYLCLLLFVAHTPDNSFLGFVVEQHLNASDIKHIDDIKRQNQSLVYGKVDNFWKVNVPHTFMTICVGG